MLFLKCITGMLVFIALAYSQQNNAWKISSVSNLSLALNYYSQNWDGGDMGSLTWQAQTNTTARRAITQWLENESVFKIGFGQTKTQDKETGNWSSPFVSTDYIDIETVFRFPLRAFIDPYTSLGLTSRFVDKRDTAYTRYFNPVEITGSMGAIRDIFREDNLVLSFRLGAAGRYHIDRDALDTLTMLRETRRTNDAGLEVVGNYTQSNEDEWLKFISRLTVYMALIRSEEEGDDDYWRYPDISWDNTLSININRYVMVQLNLQALYDREVDRNIRYKTTSSIGLTYSFSN
ncbi:hypothetical protein QA601_01945 [Chitinispirillales bacterium ANBcel5]|uniref:hypothetical protein n=1 Tax=Cellulosispirillum alkaliphilum TaxID=3039283 RepID=UPI002A52A05C|nr:hypothetical protein [Chitinispirillales bacterium ANBcel5]